MTSDYVVLLVTKEALASNEVDYERDVLHHLEMQDRRERVIAVVVDDMRFRDLPPDLGIVTALRWADGGARQVHRGIVARARDDQSRRGTRNGGKKRPS